ncbi:hypothetical protein Slin15195_G038410 [Septoria linicola]|uniref:Uncharacterized protein n=1 Tax=Septoria linicola TaxID=215465 RepID=A0A9Q9EI08_9PEZI|nr:hypothetical protein Slin14017_G119810 [Septoria linicola]USW50522.1 hypothetical protein Slin15195_G038410 [Septoria linicola]
MATASSAPKPPEGESNHSGILITTNLRWQRELYDWYLSNNITPILVEAEDYMTSPAYVKKICKAAGLDEDAAVFKWEKVPEEEQKKMHPQVQILLKTLMNSEGLRPELAVKGGASVEVEKEEEKWRVEFGEEAARFVRSEVEANMEDYWYLRERKLAVVGGRTSRNVVQTVFGVSLVQLPAYRGSCYH